MRTVGNFASNSGCYKEDISYCKGKIHQKGLISTEHNISQCLS